jgi:acyl carrier protein
MYSGIVSTDGPISNRYPFCRSSAILPPAVALASNTVTLHPCFANRIATANPPIPDPMTATLLRLELVCIAQSSLSSCIRKEQIHLAHRFTFMPPLTAIIFMSTDRNAIENALCVFLQTHVLAPGVHITPEQDFALLDIDSVTLVELAMHIEDTFGIEIPVRLLLPQHIQSVSALVTCALEHGNSVG